MQLGSKGFPPRARIRDTLLESSADRDAASRLYCRLPFDAGLDGLRVAIAAEGRNRRTAAAT